MYARIAYRRYTTTAFGGGTAAVGSALFGACVSQDLGAAGQEDQTTWHIPAAVGLIAIGSASGIWWGPSCPKLSQMFESRSARLRR